jgi:hypothetical protein
MTKKLFISLALCLSLLGAVDPVLAQADQQSREDTLAQLQREGWKIVSDGLLQRELVPGQVESFAFGVPGFTWKVKDLQRQLQKLQAEFRANPTPELRKAIANHRKAIVNAKRTLELARAAEALGEAADLSKASCAINFSYNAAGGPQTSVQGVTASASASFSGNCGFTGQVYAYAFAKAWINGAETTQTVTDGPRSGANVSATASASRNGGSPCETYSYGEMVSNSLSPATWSMTATSSSCPAVSNPPTVTINGPSYAGPTTCTTYTWTSSVSGGTAPYTYQWTWNGAAVGTGSSYSRQICPGLSYSYTTNTLALTVTDSASRTGSTSKAVDVEKFGDGGGTGCSPGKICP